MNDLSHEWIFPTFTTRTTMRFWIGGSSGLTRTYLNTFPTEPWILLGRESAAPSWMYPSQQYIRCDLVELYDGSMALSQVLKEIDLCLENAGDCEIHEIVIGVRPSLVSRRSHESAQIYNEKMLHSLKILLQSIILLYPVHLMLHISSIAAVDHIPQQRLRSVNEPDPTSHTLRYPYDRFKRGCEELVEDLARSTETLRRKRIQYTNVRLGAIFSDGPSCIQCTSLVLQCTTGPYLSTPIDCNSSRNVSHLFHLILSRFNHDAKSFKSSPQRLRPVYYYTRCISQYPKPVPYGEFFLAYRKAYGLAWLPILLPLLVVKYGVVTVCHIWTELLRSTLPSYLMPPFLESIDYLLQVTLHEHTFDMKETVQDFPAIVQLEETMEDCFRRRRALLRQQCPTFHASKSKVS
jgi:hypothetical protein